MIAVVRDSLGRHIQTYAPIGWADTIYTDVEAKQATDVWLAENFPALAKASWTEKSHWQKETSELTVTLSND